MRITSLTFDHVGFGTELNFIFGPLLAPNQRRECYALGKVCKL